MARTTSGRRFFTVKVWSEWVPPVDGTRYVEALLVLVAASGVDEARRMAWAEELESDGHETSLKETPVTTHALGIDFVYDTGRDALDDFDDDPLVFSQLFPVQSYGARNGIDSYGIDYFDSLRLTRAPTVLEPWEIDERLPESVRVEGSIQRWFGVKLWRNWSAGNDTRFHEEVVVAVRARSVEEAGRRGIELAIAADTDVVNDAGELFHVRTVNLDHVHDCESRSLIDKMGSIVFGQVFDLDEDGAVGYFDSDNDLPFRKGALG